MTMDMMLEERLTAHQAHLANEISEGFDRHAEAVAVLGVAPGLEGPVLDVGVGKGTLAIEAARLGYDVVGVDPDPEALAMAAALVDRAGLGDRVRLVRADAAQLPFADGAFGAAVSLNALHHMDDAGAVLASLVRVVRPGGLVLLADFTEAGFARVARRHMEENGHTHPVGPVTLDRAQLAMQALGLVPVAHGQTHWQQVVVFGRE